jgi:acyl-CoA thioesterase-1
MNRKRFCISLSCLGFAFAMSTASLMAQVDSKSPKPEIGSAELKVNDAGGWTFTPDPKLPDVLILGDSISIGYTLQVRDQLKGVANVYRPMMTKDGRIQPGNCMDSVTGLKKLNYWLGSNSWQVIHFNFGLHDLKYTTKDGKYVKSDQGTQVVSPEAYEKNLREMVVCLKNTGAALVWASTTPVPANTPGRMEGDEKIFNKVAEKVMKENLIQIDDLCGAVAPRFKELAIKPGNVHFNDEGYRILASNVVESIKSALKK